MAHVLLSPHVGPHPCRVVRYLCGTTPGTEEGEIIFNSLILRVKSGLPGYDKLRPGLRISAYPVVGVSPGIGRGMHTLNRRRDSDTPPGGATMNHCSHSESTLNDRERLIWRAVESHSNTAYP